MNEQGRAVDEVLADLDERRAQDPDVHGSRLFGLVYPTGRTDLEELADSVYKRYLFANALNPLKFPEQARLETELVQWVAELVHRPMNATSKRSPGSTTSGGTESILMSMLVNRERALARGVERPTILAPQTAHPAYAKAAHYFDMDYVRIPVDDGYRADVNAARSLITENTCVIVASAFTYPHGILDPVTELAGLAGEKRIGCHVDACIGGFVLPFLEQLGKPIAPWDFRVEGVTEMSVDVHKYGYVPKGVSVLLHADDDWFFDQVFFYDEWASGLYATPGVAGARPAAPVATAWAMTQHLGTDGYREIVADLCQTVDRMRAGIEAIDGIEIVGDPIGPVLALRSSTVDLHAVGDVMDDRGWNLNRNTDPTGLHMMLSPIHREAVDALLADLAEAVAHHGDSRGKEVRYS